MPQPSTLRLILNTAVFAAWPPRVRVCVLITGVPIEKMFAWGRGVVEDMCYEKFLNDEPRL
jgi:hypothetical protein